MRYSVAAFDLAPASIRRGDTNMFRRREISRNSPDDVRFSAACELAQMIGALSGDSPPHLSHTTGPRLRVTAGSQQEAVAEVTNK
jgi:hypothetical protein